MNKQSNIYKGAVKDSKKEGFGIVQYENGAKFMGFFTNNRANGWGYYRDENKSIFEGIY